MAQFMTPTFKPVKSPGPAKCPPQPSFGDTPIAQNRGFGHAQQDRNLSNLEPREEAALHNSGLTWFETS
ncbi:MAG TPA: hypothetical protein VK641_10565, partial [Terriglobales bacterium]|nr:hypothetical protein [Terriglobales bacterium]